MPIVPRASCIDPDPRSGILSLVGTTDPDAPATLLGASHRGPVVSSDGICVERIGAVLHVDGLPCVTVRAALAEIARLRVSPRVVRLVRS